MRLAAKIIGLIVFVIVAAASIAHLFVTGMVSSKLDEAANQVMAGIADAQQGTWVCDQHDAIEQLINGKRPAVADEHCFRLDRRLLVSIKYEGSDGYVRFSSALKRDMWTSVDSLHRG